MQNLFALGKKLYGGFVTAVSSTQSLFLLAVRLYWGWQLAQNGWGKLHNLANVTEFFTSLGIPAPGPTAAFVATFELVGGILLALGLFSRITALGIAADMIVAYVTADREALLTFFSNPGKFYVADPYTFLFAGLLILIFGPGKIALDTLADRIANRAAQGPALKVCPGGHATDRIQVRATQS
ncbi:MAG: DoxX family protein [Candidatus Acidiferrales bacterium]